MNIPTRPALRWHGGKWRLAPWIISHFPAHRVYVEPFGGAASVLIRKPRSYAEVYNDLDGEVVNFFRVLRDESQAARLIQLLALTPFARREFDDAYEATADCVEAARRLVIRSFMGFGADGFNSSVRTGFRASVTRLGTIPAHDWAGYPDCAAAIARRLRGVVIEHRNAAQVMSAHDSLDTLHYVDPPYLSSTRSGNRFHAYRHEMTDEDHASLLVALRAVAGMVILSGYPSPLYDDALSDWQRVETPAFADGARPRTEVLWLNPACAERLAAERVARDMPLFVETSAS